MHVLPKLASVPPVIHMPHFGNTTMIQIPHFTVKETEAQKWEGATKCAQ